MCNLGTGYTKEGITFPSRHAQLVLEQQVCQAADINPADITYVEAHGTGTVAGPLDGLTSTSMHHHLHQHVLQTFCPVFACSASCCLLC